MLIRKIVKHKNIKHIIQIDSYLEWLWPYVKLSQKLGIPIHSIKKIKGYYVQANKLERQMAQCACYLGRFTITLLRLRQEYIMTKKGNFKVEGWSDCAVDHYKDDTLQSLAHELSHTIHWKHNAERLILEMKLMLVFARYAKRTGYEEYK
jgi:hypothetical protein